MADYFDAVAAVAGGPTLHWTCQDASGDLVDVVAARNGTVTSTPTYQVTGPAAGIPYAIAMGPGQYFTVADHADVDLGNGPFSILAWVRKTDAGNFSVVVKGGADDTGYRMAQVAGLMRLTGGSGTNRVRQTTSDTATTWELYAFVWNGASSIFELNGTDDTTISSTTALSDNADALVIGPAGGFSGYELGGLMFWKGTALSAANIQAVYDARNDTDGGGGGGGGEPQLMGWGLF